MAQSPQVAPTSNPAPETPTQISNHRERRAPHQAELPTNNPVDADDPFVVPHNNHLPQVDRRVTFLSPSQGSPWLHSPSDAPQQLPAPATPQNPQTEDFRWVFETPSRTPRVNQRTPSTPTHRNHGRKDKTPRSDPHSTQKATHKHRHKHKKTDDVYPFFPMGAGSRRSCVFCQ